jgi:hypothetical protein
MSEGRSGFEPDIVGALPMLVTNDIGTIGITDWAISRPAPKAPGAVETPSYTAHSSLGLKSLVAMQMSRTT